MDIRALLPILLLALALVGYCLYDLTRVPAVRWLPKWGWAIVCMVSVPLGPILYLTLGRTDA
jgi:hypothetical protein